MENNKDDAFFPDPRPIIPACLDSTTSQNINGDDEGSEFKESPCIYLNDVSRMSAYPNGTPVSKIFFPRCEEDVLDILRAAYSERKQIGIRGAKHSMGQVT